MQRLRRLRGRLPHPLPEDLMRKELNQAAPQKRRRNDLLLLAGILLAVAVFALVYTLTRKEGGYAAVIQNGTETARYSLSEEQEIPIADGETVTNLLVIRDGKAYMAEATCPDQICVEHRPVSKAGETIVCLPHELVIKIVASEPDAPDMVV